MSSSRSLLFAFSLSLSFSRVAVLSKSACQSAFLTTIASCVDSSPLLFEVVPGAPPATTSKPSVSVAISSLAFGLTRFLSDDSDFDLLISAHFLPLYTLDSICPPCESCRARLSFKTVTSVELVLNADVDCHQISP